jgi:hypothetical protein
MNLPIMKTLKDAVAFAEKEHDQFYVTAFHLQSWLSSVLVRTIAEYAEKKNPRGRTLQNGESWTAFLQAFDSPPSDRFRSLLGCLFRFCKNSVSSANSLLHALTPLVHEHNLSHDYFGPETTASATQGREGNELARRTIVRWCDWLDAAIHLRVHRYWHRAPSAFDPDPETRKLAMLGDTQYYVGKLDERAKACWLHDFTDAADQFKDSPKWAAFARAMAAASAVNGNGSNKFPARPWLYPGVDTLVIALWPLLKKHNWTYRDLLNTIRPALKRPKAYPSDREQDFATYCTNVLGLRKTGKGVSAKNGRPHGHEIAERLCPALAKKAFTPPKP